MDIDHDVISGVVLTTDPLAAADDMLGIENQPGLAAPARLLHRHLSFTGRLKINHPAFRFSKSTSIVVSITLNSFKEHHGDVTTGVRRWFQRGVEGEPAGNNMTRPATQVGPRAVEAGLGGHDAGV